MIAQAKSTLQKIFGFSEFRPLQQDVIANVLNQKDTLVIMPTGGGKSLCYQIPALLFNGLTVVVSPLISLMQDQIAQLQALDVQAVGLNSSLSENEYRTNMALIRSGKAKLLYVAPETLQKDSTLTLLKKINIDCLTIDEAHCISEWGHDFRPEYRRLAAVRKRFPEAACVALTATATPRVREDIQQSLNFKQGNEFIASFNRDNLFLEIADKVSPYQQTIEFIEKFRDQSGIVYCMSRRQVDELAQKLHQNGFSVRAYHAGLDETTRKQNQELFIKDDIQIMVATVAFGMGINKPNVRFVVHYDLPKNIEHYYQEIGRAGRDGLPAHCLLLFGHGDIRKVKFFISQMPSEQEQRVAQLHLNALLQMIETDICRRIPLLNYFGEPFGADACAQCDNCTTEKQPLTDLTEPAQKFLSCIKRTGERFGAGHIVDVLRGSESQKVLKLNHQRLSTYGIGLEFSKKQWMHLSRQFIQKGLLEQDPEFGSLKLTAKALSVLRGSETFMGLLEAHAPARKVKTPASELPYDEDLFQLLRKTRKLLADNLGVPPYVVFADKTLIEMAFFFPHTQKSLLTLHGVGATKAKRFGAEFLSVVQNYCQEHGIEERTKTDVQQTQSTTALPHTTAPKKHALVGEAFNKGQSIKSLMTDHEVQLGTVLKHLQKHAEENPLRAEGLLQASSLCESEQQKVFALFKQLGATYLKPVHESMDGEVAFDELRLLQLYWLHAG